MTDEQDKLNASTERLLRTWGADRAVEEADLPEAPAIAPTGRLVRVVWRIVPVAAAASVLAGLVGMIAIGVMARSQPERPAVSDSRPASRVAELEARVQELRRQRDDALAALGRVAESAGSGSAPAMPQPDVSDSRPEMTDGHAPGTAAEKPARAPGESESTDTYYQKLKETRRELQTVRQQLAELTERDSRLAMGDGQDVNGKFEKKLLDSETGGSGAALADAGEDDDGEWSDVDSFRDQPRSAPIARRPEKASELDDDVASQQGQGQGQDQGKRNGEQVASRLYDKTETAVTKRGKGVDTDEAVTLDRKEAEAPADVRTQLDRTRAELAKLRKDHEKTLGVVEGLRDELQQTLRERESAEQSYKAKLAAASEKLAEAKESHETEIRRLRGVESDRIAKLEKARTSLEEDLQRIYLKVSSKGKEGLAARQQAVWSNGMLDRSADLADDVRTDRARKLIDQLEVLLLRLDLLRIGDEQAESSFAAAVSDVEVDRQVESVLNLRRDPRPVQLWLLEAKMILSGVDDEG